MCAESHAPLCPPTANSTIRILVFGDGNFSFGAALARILKGRTRVTLVVTSFDDEQSLKVRSMLNAKPFNAWQLWCFRMNQRVATCSRMRTEAWSWVVP